MIFQVAGQCGLGALSAAQEKNVRGIGVDADQAYLGEPRPHERAEEGRRRSLPDDPGRAGRQLPGGENTVFDVASGGVGLGEIASDVPADLVSQVNTVQDEIAAGEITNIPETVG